MQHSQAQQSRRGFESSPRLWRASRRWIAAGLALASMLGAGWAGAQPVNAAALAPIYIDDSQAARDAQREVDLLLSSGRVPDAAQQLRSLIGDHGDALIEAEPGAYVPARVWAARRLASDPRLLDSYRQRYEAQAQHAFDRAVESGDGQAFIDMADAYPQTAAGWRALLEGAARLVESGQAERALPVLDGRSAFSSVLDELGPQAVDRWTALHTAALAMAVEWSEPEVAVGPLGPAVAPQSGLALQAQAVKESARRWLALARQSHPQVDTPDRAIWSRSWRRLLVEQSLFEAEQDPMDGGALGEAPSPSSLAVAGEWVVVADGLSVAKVDLRSGALGWVYRPTYTPDPPIEEPDPGQARARAMQMAQMRRGGGSRDEGGVAVVDGTVYAALKVQPENDLDATRRGSRSLPESRLVAIDLDTGQERWSLRPEQWQDRLSLSWMIGRPVVSAGRVHVAIRQLRGSGFGDTFVVAADADTGAPAWHRHVSSVVHRGGWPMQGDLLAARRGWLYVTDGAGVVAKLAARSGAVDWLRVYDTGVDASSRRGARELDPPVPLDAGVLVRIRADRGLQGWLLDRQTGAQLPEPSEGLATAERWLPAGPHVLAVGQEVALYDGTDLSVRWRAPGVSASGRDIAAWAGRGFVLVSARSQTTALDLDTGGVLARVGRGTTVIVGGDGQCVLVRGDELQSFAGWETVRAALSGRADEQSDPSGLLGLARIGLANADAVAVRGAIDGAVRLLDAQESRLGPDALGGPGDIDAGQDANPVRAVVFDQMLMMAGRADAQRTGVRDFLLESASGVARTASQAMRFHLAIGDRLSSGADADPAEAAAHFQAVLSDDALGEEMYRADGLTRQARLEAASRLATLIQTHGRSCYARFEAEAQAELDSMRVLGADAGGYLDLARRYPSSRAAGEATWRAASSFAERGEHAAAVGYYRRAFALTDDRTQRGAVASEFARYYRDRGQPFRAARWLERVATQDASLPLNDGDSPTTPAQWAGVLRSGVDPGDLGSTTRFGLTGAARRMPGRLVDEMPGARADRTVGVLVQNGSLLGLLDAPGGALRWVVPMPGESVRVVSARRNQFVLWVDDKAPLALDARDGSVRWRGAEMAPSVVHGAEDVETRRRTLRDRQASLIPEPESHVLLGVAETVLVALGPGGQVVGVDLTDGQVLWRRTLPGDVPDRLVVGDDLAVAITREQAPNNGATRYTLALLEAYTGDDQAPPQRSDEAPAWAGVLPDGSAVVAFENRVQVMGALGAEPAWQVDREQFEDQLVGPGVSSAQLLALHGKQADVNQSAVVAIDIGQGVFRRRVSLNSMAGGVTLHRVGSHIVAVDHAGLVALDGRGERAWRLSQDGQTVAGHAPAGGSLFALVQETGTPLGRTTPGQQAVWVVEGTSGRLTHAIALPPEPAIDGATLRVTGAGLAVQAGESVLLLGIVAESEPETPSRAEASADRPTVPPIAPAGLASPAPIPDAVSPDPEPLP
ncbi:MAG: PQQ-binding-like beta-propeller repeat protein [Planctomycetota bacterium]